MELMQVYRSIIWVYKVYWAIDPRLSGTRAKEHKFLETEVVRAKCPCCKLPVLRNMTEN